MVMNRGDTPLYITLPNFNVYVDGNDVACTLNGTNVITIMPGEEESVGLTCVPYSIGIDELSVSHTIVVTMANAETTYTIPALSPEIVINNVGYSQIFGTTYVDNITITLYNNWEYPINVNWISIYVNGQSYLVSIAPGWLSTIGPGQSAQLTITLAVPVEKGSVINIILGKTNIQITT